MRYIAILIICLLQYNDGVAQSEKDYINIPLNNFSAFRNPSQKWKLVRDVRADYTRHHYMRVVKGSGILFSGTATDEGYPLFTTNDFGDIELQFDFMVSKGAQIGILLQGRYKVMLSDSWTKQYPSSSDAGAIAAMSNEGVVVYDGTAPLMNVARSPGLWQQIGIRFAAARFNDAGIKISNARIEQIILNGVEVQRQAELSTTEGNIYDIKSAMGPLVFKAISGPVAIRNIRYRSPAAIAPAKELLTPVFVNASNRTKFIRSFFMHGSNKLTHAIAVGNTNGVNYAYDLKQGAIFQVWRGQFLDLAKAWRSRGQSQLAEPCGSVITLSDAPLLAVLRLESDDWPDSVAFDDFTNHGYETDKSGSPTFSYSISGMKVNDFVMNRSDGKGLNRSITVSENPVNLYARIGEGSVITSLGKNRYAINDKKYYIEVDSRLKPSIIPTKQGYSLVVKYNNSVPLNYSIIW